MAGPPILEIVRPRLSGRTLPRCEESNLLLELRNMETRTDHPLLRVLLLAALLQADAVAH